ncbi:MAG TPA: methyl-accepting chemotaxis protein [Kofleriaceae bacterium]
MSKSLVNRIRLVYLPFDLLFGVLIPLAVVNVIDPADRAYWSSLFVFWFLSAGRTVAIQLLIKQIFGPAAHWIEIAPSRPEAREVRYADEVLRNGPQRFTATVIVLWLVQLALGMAWLLFHDRYNADIAMRSVVTVGLMAGAILLGTIPFAAPLVSLLIHSTARKLFAIAHGAGIPLHREPASLKLKLIVLVASAGLAGPLWMASTSYAGDGVRATADARSRAAATAAELARAASKVDPSNTAKLAELTAAASRDGAQASIFRAGDPAAVDRELPPPLTEWLKTPLPQQGTDTKANPRDAQVAARAPTSNDLVALVVLSVNDWASTSLVVTLIIFFLVIVSWAPMSAYFLARDVVDPLDEITRTVIQVTEIGKLGEVAAIAVTQDDEVGTLSARFNDLIDMLRGLSIAASALAKGDLEIKLSGEGDVATAFRVMIGSLGKIVRQIHETSVLLAAAATEIYAASQEQEAAAASQSTAMVEIRQTMESLFEAAAHVSESVRGVLSNAERTLETTDRMVIRIGDLTTHAGRIGEILETIRDISDRSDLLALNGALEASRAGEAGRGFGLVAAEMRRLAERVMSSVHDVRSLVGDIRASGSSTMMATEDSKKLAASTTDAARQITLVTQQQRSGTEQVLQSVREIAETLTQSVAAMAQTRASAEQLKSQADKLSSLVQAFRIENPPT